MTLPVVDMTTPEEQLWKLFDKAMTESGFCVLINHGVDPIISEEMFNASREFFWHNSQEQKMAFNHGSYGVPVGGYTKIGQETVARSLEKGSQSPPDLVENYALPGKYLRSNESFSGFHHDNILNAGRKYYREMIRLMERVHEISALAFGKPKDFFLDYFTPPDVSLRLSHYPPLSMNESVLPGQIRYGAHTDYTGFTFLNVEKNNIEGLQISLNDEWRDVTDIPENSFIVNIGDLMSLWTGGRWKATLHRVVNPPRSSRDWSQSRFSIPFFTGPRLDACIKPLDDPEAVGINAGEWLRAKLGQSNNYTRSQAKI